MMYFQTDLTAGNAAGNRGGARNTGTENLLFFPVVLARSLSPWFCASWSFLSMFCDFGSLFRTLRRQSGQLLRQRQSSTSKTFDVPDAFSSLARSLPG